MRYGELGCVSHRADDPEDKDKRRLNVTRRRIQRWLRRRQKEERRQHAFGGPMAAQQRGRQAAVGRGASRGRPRPDSRGGTRDPPGGKRRRLRLGISAGDINV
eukprot:1719698-Pleurochrysis_carterae.AAC.1